MALLLDRRRFLGGLAIAAYMAFPIVPEDVASVRANNLYIGLGLSLALLALGIGAASAMFGLIQGVLLSPPPYRLQREGDNATGKRATLSVAVGATLPIVASVVATTLVAPDASLTVSVTVYDPLSA